MIILNSSTSNDATYVKTLIHIKGPQPLEIIPRKVIDYSHEVFPSDRNDKHTEMEYSIPYEDGVVCFKEIRNLSFQRNMRSFGQLNIEQWQRTLVDRPSKGRLTVTISIHQGLDQPQNRF